MNVVGKHTCTHILQRAKNHCNINIQRGRFDLSEVRLVYVANRTGTPDRILIFRQLHVNSFEINLLLDLRQDRRAIRKTNKPLRLN